MKMRVTRKTSAPPRVVLYGPEGIGKTTFGAESENPIFVCTEDGATEVPVDKFVFDESDRAKAESWPEFLGALKTIAEEEHDYNTLVVDTWNYATAMAAKHVCDHAFGGSWAKFLAYGGNQGWPATVEELKPALIAFDKCRARGMTVILLAHDGTQSVKNPIQGDYHRFAGDMDKRAWNAVAQWADCVGHADYHYDVVETRDAQGNAKKGRAIGGTTRIVRWHGTAAEAAKNRVGYELPETTPLSYQAFKANLGRDTYTLEQCRELWGVLSTEEVGRALTWLGVETLEEAPVFKLRQLLTHLQAKAANQNKEDSNDRAA